MKIAFILIPLFLILLGGCNLFDSSSDDSNPSLLLSIKDAEGKAVDSADIYFVYDGFSTNPQKSEFPPVWLYYVLTDDFYPKVLWGCDPDSNIRGFELLRATNNNILDSRQIGPFIEAHPNPECITYEVIDTDIVPGEIYFYWLTVVMYDQSISMWGPIYCITGPLPQDSIPSLWNLHVYHSEFAYHKQIYYAVPQATPIRIEAYNSIGERIVIYRSNAAAWHYSFVWDGTDLDGNDLPNGIYKLYIFDDAPGFVQEAKASTFVLKNNPTLSNLPSISYVGEPLKLSFERFFGFKILLNVFDHSSASVNKRTLPPAFKIIVHAAGYENKEVYVHIENLNKDQKLEIILTSS